MDSFGMNTVKRGVLAVRLEEIQAIADGLSTATDILDAIKVVRERTERLARDMEALSGA